MVNAKTKDATDHAQNARVDTTTAHYAQIKTYTRTRPSKQTNKKSANSKILTTTNMRNVSVTITIPATNPIKKALNLK